MLLAKSTCGQTFGPNSPSSGTNSTSIGTFSWASPGNVLSSNNSHASVTSKGITNYLSGTNFGFTIPATTSISGIQLDIEKSTLSPTVVTLLNSWTAGLTKTISAGTNRILLFIASMENGSGARDITTLRYGGQAMTQIVEGVVGTTGGFQAKLEFWVLLESGIASATSTAFTATFNAVTLTENVEYYTSAVYAGVDQFYPYTSTQIYTTTATGSTITVSPTLATTGGGMVVSAIHCGNNTTPARGMGGTNTYQISNTFTETVDTYSGCACTNSATGMCTEVAHQTIATSGTVAPSYTFAGTPNRQIVIYVNLTCVRELDNSVRLIKAGAVTGNNLAYTITPWNTADTYTSYGSSSNLWGTTWAYSDINATNFGAVISASVNNGTARVDHMRITVTAVSTLPVELLDFSGYPKASTNILEWQTASEHNNSYFEVERSTADGTFETVGKVNGSGDSRIFKAYGFTDEKPLSGLNYYRLKQTDYDGTYFYSKIISVVSVTDKVAPISVYPNPTSGFFKLASEQVMQNGVFIYSEDLRLIKIIDCGNKKELEGSVTELTDGTYFVITSVGGQQKITKLLKVCR